MKLPTVEELRKIIAPSDEIKEYCRPYDTAGQWPERGRLVSGDTAEEIAGKIIALIKESQFEETPEVPEVDPNLVKIAELEAKVMVYESVISSAGIKLGMPKNNANRVRAQKGEAK